MQTTSTLPAYLSDEQCDGIREIVSRVECLPISCLFHTGDCLAGAENRRSIPDDFFFIPFKGDIDCSVGNVRRIIRPGEFIMVPARVRHGVGVAEGCDSYEVCALHMHLYDALQYRFLKRMESPFGLFSDVDAWRRRLAACTCLMGKNPELGSVVMQQLVIALLTEQLLHNKSVREETIKIDPRIYSLICRIRENPGKDWTVTRMAEVASLSVSRLRDLFVASMGMAPSKFVNSVRLSLARSLLVTRPELTVEQVANMVGISSQQHFYEAYRVRFGETPRRRGSGDGVDVFARA